MNNSILLPEDKLLQYKNKWLNIGKSTETLNVPAAMLALKDVYAQAGLECPQKYEVYDSPFEAITEMKLRYDLTVTNIDFVYGAQDAPWLSFYDCIQKEMGVKGCEKLAGLMEFAKHSGWALLLDELIVLTHKPIQIKLNEQNVLHCEDDLAIKFRDGEGVASWRGTRIPPCWIFDSATITPEVLLHWENIEQRRAACEIVGWAETLKLLNSTVIDKDEDESIGTLLEVNIPDIGSEKFLLVVDPNTNKFVGLPVPPEMKTALQANSWTYGIDPFEFKPTFRV